MLVGVLTAATYNGDRTEGAYCVIGRERAKNVANAAADWESIAEKMIHQTEKAKGL